MKFQKLLIIMALVASATMAMASRLAVAVAYGANGSHGTYMCYLYKGGYLYDIKQVRNTGFASGTAEFDVPKNDKYFAYIHCVTNNTGAIAGGQWFYWYTYSLTLTARF